MATIGQLVINVGMDVADMIGASEKAEKSFSRMVKGMERDARSMRKDLNNLGSEFVTMGEYAIAAAGVALVAVVKHSFDTIDALGKTSDALGISTEKLAELQYAASLAGVDSEKFNSSMFTMTKNVADASMGIGKAQIAFKELGINVDDLVGMAPDKQFELMADKIGAIENPAIKAQLAMKVFGSSGAEMLTVMKDGAGGLKAAADEADALGLSISRVDAAQIEQANDAMQAAGGVFAGVGNTIAITLAPMIEGMSKRFIQSAIDADGFKDIIESGFDKIVTAAGWVATGLKGIGLVLLILEEAFLALKATSLSVIAVMVDKFGGLIEWLGGKIALIGQTLSEIWIFFGQAMQESGIPGLKELGVGLEAVGASGKWAADGIKKLTEGTESTSKAAAMMADDAISALADVQKERAEYVKSMEKPIDYHKNIEAFKKSSETMSAQAEKHYDKEQALNDSKLIKYKLNLQKMVDAHFVAEKKMDDEAVKYIAKSVIDTSSGQDKLRAEYDATMKQFSGNTDAQLKAQEVAGEIYRTKTVELHGKIAAEMRDKNYDALKAMVTNTEDKSAEMVEKRQAAMDEMELRDNSWGQNFKDKFIEGTGAGKSFYDQVGVMGTTFGTATTGMFKNVFEDGFNGNLTTAKGYVDAFVKSINGVLAQILAETVVKGILAKFADVFNPVDTAIATAKGTADGSAYGTAFAAASSAAGGAPAGGAAAPAAPAAAGYVGASVGGGAPAAGAAPAANAASGGAGAAGAAVVVIAGAAALAKWNSDANFSAYTPEEAVSTFPGLYQRLKTQQLKYAKSHPGELTDITDGLKEKFASYRKAWIDAYKIVNNATPNYEQTADVFKIPTGVLPANAYASGGIADRPQMAIFGEGSMNEAFVPLPDGKTIPVTMKGGNQQSGDVVLMLDGQILGRILNGMSKQGRLKIDPIAIQSAYAV